jgi:HD-GYP domain-containing protein (c-di-GMP phosphodiesterase class II)
MYRQKLLQQQSLHSSIINAIKRTMYEKSNETEEHAERMAVHARKLGKAMGMGETDLVTLELLATLHDIGKISIDQKILKKPGPLNDTELLEMKKHPEVGYRITNASPELRHIAKYILYHHERWDGTGYPYRLRGEKIPLHSRIISVVDAYDAMTRGRPYKKAISPRGGGGGADPKRGNAVRSEHRERLRGTGPAWRSEPTERRISPRRPFRPTLPRQREQGRAREWITGNR